MAYIKSKSIHAGNQLKNSINYILNDKKTDLYLLCDGLNTSINNEIALQNFEQLQNLYKRNTYSSTNKKQVVAHHFVQSFNKNENITPEQALEVGLSTCKEHFGEKAQILISTHVDKEHIHNHIIVNSVDFDGRRIHDNWKNRNALREVSDKICLERGFSVIKEKNYTGLKYNRWAEKQKGISWKDKFKLNIDKAILNSNSISDLQKELEKFNYESKITVDKKENQYLEIRDKKFKQSYFVKTKNLGDDYTFEKLEYRIKNKDEEIINRNDERQLIFGKINNYKNNEINYKYLSTIKLISVLIKTNKINKMKKYNSLKPYSPKNDFYINKLVNELNFLSSQNITSVEIFNKRYDEIEKNKNEIKSKIDLITKTYKNNDNEIFNEKLNLLKPKIEKLVSEFNQLKEIKQTLEDIESKQLEKSLTAEKIRSKER